MSSKRALPHHTVLRSHDPKRALKTALTTYINEMIDSYQKEGELEMDQWNAFREDFDEMGSRSIPASKHQNGPETEKRAIQSRHFISLTIIGAIAAYLLDTIISRIL